MADDKRLQVLKLLCAQLETITTGNGYQHDLTGSVFRGRTAFDESEAPAVTLMERPAYDDDFLPSSQAEFLSEGWQLVLQGFIAADKNHPTDPAYRLMADCKLALSELRKVRIPNLLGGLATKLTIYPGVVLPPDKEKAPNQAQFILLVTVSMVDDASKPYSDS